jgi:hypothetical protein
MSKKRIELSQSCKSLLEFSAGDLIPELEDSEPNTISVSMQAFQHYSSKTKETFEVQVIVTRRVDDFIEPFTTVYNTEYKLS